MKSQKIPFHYIGQLTMSKGKNSLGTLPKEDIVDWRFMKVGKHMYGFLYVILSPETARYNVPFKVKMSFLCHNKIRKTCKLGDEYQILRGQEIVGTVKLLSYYDGE